jgi:hypothetical protein
VPYTFDDPVPPATSSFIECYLATYLFSNRLLIYIPSPSLLPAPIPIETADMFYIDSFELTHPEAVDDSIVTSSGALVAADHVQTNAAVRPGFLPGPSRTTQWLENLWQAENL